MDTMEDIKENSVNIRYERNNGVNYAVINSDKDSDWDNDYEIKMLMHNTPQHFLEFTINEIDDEKSIYYDISSKQQLSRLFEYGKVTMEDVKVLFSNLSEMVRVIDEYMLNLDRVMLNPKHIYVSLADKKYSFMYLPSDSNISFYDNMRSLFEYILERFDHSVEKSSLVRFYEIYQKILVRDYTPHKLMDFFADDKGLNADVAEVAADDTEYIDNYDMQQAKYPEYEAFDTYSAARSIQNGDRYNTTGNTQNIAGNIHNTAGNTRNIAGNTQNIAGMKENGKERYNTPGYQEEKVIKAVMPEIAEKDKTKKNSKLLAGIFKLIAVILILNAAASMFFEEYAIIKLNAAGSIICMIAGFLIFYISGKLASFIGELISEDKVTEDEIMPYRMKMTKDDGNTYGVHNVKKNENVQGMHGAKKNENAYGMHGAMKDENAYRAQTAKGNENIYSDIDNESAEPLYKDMVTARVMEDEKPEAMVNHTMLLSDYLKLLKDNKLTLEILDNSGAMLRMENKEKYEQPLDKIELEKYPCTIGSLDGSADIFIASPVVSKMHACILQDDDKFYVEDMNSTNGTYVNDERIAMNIKTRIADGDILRVASYNFKVCIS